MLGWNEAARGLVLEWRGLQPESGWTGIVGTELTNRWNVVTQGVGAAFRLRSP